MKQITIVFLFFSLSAWTAVSPIWAQEKPDALAKYRAGRDFETRGRESEANANYDEAIRICQDEINGNQATSDSYAVLTWALQRQKKYAEVIRWGQRALRIQSDYRVIETMGEAYFYLENYNESLKNMERYTNTAQPGDRSSTAYFFIGEIYRVQRKFHYADIAYTTAVRLEPGMALWWFRLGLAREALGDKMYAAEAFERALRINPADTRATEALDRVRKPA
ncbi:MAG: tetratricopeptide repeat protein [Spirochaetaceae bacterium]|jgi:tetratricopeptide (TPR) repeat protein|nr:tetratricopeptide repeat protein [Spirochaetaceae bacterium]